MHRRYAVYKGVVPFVTNPFTGRPLGWARRPYDEANPPTEATEFVDQNDPVPEAAPVVLTFTKAVAKGSLAQIGKPVVANGIAEARELLAKHLTTKATPKKDGS